MPTLLAAVAGVLTGCDSRPLTADAPPPVFYQAGSHPQAIYTETVLDWPGTYQGLLPCDGCPGVAISVQLRAGKTANIRERYVNQPSPRPLQTYSGSFYFDPMVPGMIVMGQPERPQAAARFMVSAEGLELRDAQTGAAMPNPEQYLLRKTSVPLDSQ